MRPIKTVDQLIEDVEFIIDYDRSAHERLLEKLRDDINAARRQDFMKGYELGMSEGENNGRKAG